MSCGPREPSPERCGFQYRFLRSCRALTIPDEPARTLLLTRPMTLPSRPTHALVIDRDSADLLIAGRKTWEVRPDSTAVRGAIAIAAGETVVARCELVDCIGPLTRQDLVDHAAGAHLPAHEPLPVGSYAWILERPRRLVEPLVVRRKDPGGFVRLTPEAAILIGDAPTTRFRWINADFAPGAEHLVLSYAESDGLGSGFRVAAVAWDGEETFLVKFDGDRRQAQWKEACSAVARELDFYLVTKGEARPWAYARDHCSTQANAGSRVHWAYWPAVRHGLKLTFQGEPPQRTPSFEAASSAVHRLSAYGPTYVILDGLAGDFAQAGGDGSSFTVEWRDHSGTHARQSVAGHSHQGPAAEAAIATRTGRFRIYQHERLDASAAQALLCAFAAGEPRPDRFDWRELTADDLARGRPVAPATKRAPDTMDTRPKTPKLDGVIFGLGRGPRTR